MMIEYLQAMRLARGHEGEIDCIVSGEGMSKPANLFLHSQIEQACSV
jgi:hypothetical protein